MLDEFDGLVEAHPPAMLKLARRLVWDMEDARDVLQVALSDAWAQRAQLKDPVAAPAWLRRIVVHRAMSVLRRRRVWKAIGALLFVAPEAPAQPDDHAEQSAHLRALSAALADLSPKQNAAFTLRYLEGWSLDDVAAARDCGRGTARVHLQRAVSALRERGVLP